MFVRRFRCERDDVTVDWISALKYESHRSRREEAVLVFNTTNVRSRSRFTVFVVRLRSGEEVGKRLSFHFLFFVAKIERFEDALGEPFHARPTVFKFRVDVFLTRVYIS